MKIRGSNGEGYRIDKNRMVQRGMYTEYALQGSGDYIVRIYKPAYRRGLAEMDIKEAVSIGGLYDEVYPLNVLYSGKRFVGFLYQGDLPYSPQIETEDELEIGAKTGTGGSSLRSILDIFSSAEAIWFFVLGFLGIVLFECVVVNPLFNRYLDGMSVSTIAGFLSYLNYKGVPAIVVGIAAFISIWRKMPHGVFGCVLSVVAGMIASAIFAVIVLVLISLVEGAVAFLLKYFLVIILCIIALIWLRNLIFGRRR